MYIRACLFYCFPLLIIPGSMRRYKEFFHCCIEYHTLHRFLFCLICVTLFFPSWRCGRPFVFDTVISVSTYYYMDISVYCKNYFGVLRKYSYFGVLCNNSTVFARLFPYLFRTFYGMFRNNVRVFCACCGRCWFALFHYIGGSCPRPLLAFIGALWPFVFPWRNCLPAPVRASCGNPGARCGRPAVVLWCCPSGSAASVARSGAVLCIPSGALASVRVRRWFDLLPAVLASWSAAVLVRMPSGVVPAVGSAARVRRPAARPRPDLLRVRLRASVHLPACAPARACASAYPWGIARRRRPSTNPLQHPKKQKSTQKSVKSS